MKRLTIILSVCLSVSVIFSVFAAKELVSHQSAVTKEKQELADAKAKLKSIQDKEEADQRLGQYVLNMLYMTSGKKTLSDTKKQIVARNLVDVTNDIFDNPEHKKAFIAVVAIESGFNSSAQSPTGPKGMAQMAKASFKEGMALCGSPSVNEDDVWDSKINLYSGACYFKMLLERHGGDPYAAIVSYNQGANSDASKTYSKYGSMDNIEALKYVAKFTFLKRNVTEEKKEGVPSIAELPKPGKK